jgi:hypothetical protein
MSKNYQINIPIKLINKLTKNTITLKISSKKVHSPKTINKYQQSLTIYKNPLTPKVITILLDPLITTKSVSNKSSKKSLNNHQNHFHLANLPTIPV